MPVNLKDQTHRPYFYPTAPWVMAQDWCDLLFAHWPVPVDKVSAFLPPGLELDTFDGMAWIGVVPFRMANVHPRGLPSLPWISYFLELNLRTYVRYKNKTGVFFFSLDASNPVAVQIARNLYFLPYFNAKMSLEKDADWTNYTSARVHQGSPDLKFEASYRPIEAVVFSEPGSLEAFLTERYCLFVPDRAGNIFCGDIHHGPWPLQRAEAEIRINQMGDQYRFDLTGKPLLHYVSKLETVEWPISKSDPD